MLQRRTNILAIVASHSAIFIHEFSSARTLRANVLETLKQHIFCFMDFHIQELHEEFNSILFNIAARYSFIILNSLHCQSRHDNSYRTNIATTIFALTETIDIPTICSTTTHSREISTRVIYIITSIARPVYICIVWIQTSCSGLKCHSLQIIVWSTWLFINTRHNLEDTARENRGLAQTTSSFKRAVDKSLNNQSSFWTCTSAIVNRSER